MRMSSPRQDVCSAHSQRDRQPGRFSQLHRIATNQPTHPQIMDRVFLVCHVSLRSLPLAPSSVAPPCNLDKQLASPRALQGLPMALRMAPMARPEDPNPSDRPLLDSHLASSLSFASMISTAFPGSARLAHGIGVTGASGPGTHGSGHAPLAFWLFWLHRRSSPDGSSSSSQARAVFSLSTSLPWARENLESTNSNDRILILSSKPPLRNLPCATLPRLVARLDT